MSQECLLRLIKTFRYFNYKIRKTLFDSQDEDFWKISNVPMFLLKGISLKQSMIKTAIYKTDVIWSTFSFKPSMQGGGKKRLYILKETCSF